MRTRPSVVALAGLLAAGLLLVPATTYNFEAGRYSGLWNIVRAAPSLGGHVNLGVFSLGFGGMLAVAGWLAGVGARSRWVLLGALCGFVAAVSVPGNAWTRYHEPMLLMWAAIASALIVQRETEPQEPKPGETVAQAGVGADSVGGRVSGFIRLVRLAGLAGLCLLMIGITALKLSTEDRAVEPKRTQRSLERALSSLWPEAWHEKWGDAPSEDGAEPREVPD